jgi:hypothetical protein
MKAGGGGVMEFLHEAIDKSPHAAYSLCSNISINKGLKKCTHGAACFP